jgi:Tol biopolymer transport system component
VAATFVALVAVTLPAGVGSAVQPSLVFASSRAENRYPEIYVARSDGHGVRDLSRSPYADSGAAVSPSGRLVAFVSDREGGQEPSVVGVPSALYVVGVDGKRLMRLTNPAVDGNATSPSWSPDERRIVVSASAAGKRWIEIVDLRGHRMRLAESGIPTWSPGGSRIAVWDQRPPEHVFVVRPDGRHLWSSYGSFPRWSPDGAKIAIVTGAACPACRGVCPACRTTIRGASGRLLASYPGMLVDWLRDGVRLVLSQRDGRLVLRRLGRAGSVTISKAGGGVVSPDGSRLAVTDERGTTRIVRIPGGNARVVAHAAFAAGWSPDSKRLALVSYSPAAIWIVGADGSGRVRAASAPAGSSLSAVAWTPDSRSVVYGSEHDRNDTELYTMHADGSGLKQLTKDTHMQFSPAWSPDGTRIAYSWASMCCPDVGPLIQPGYIHVMNADGSHQRLLTSGYGDDSPAWSPDSQTIVYTHPNLDQYGDEQGSQLELVASDGSARPTTLYQSSGIVLDPAWSPDGTTIAFASTEDGGGIFTIHPDGSGLTKLVSPASFPMDARSPVWSPDGSRLAFADTQDGIYIVNADGSASMQIPGAIGSMV